MSMLSQAIIDSKQLKEAAIKEAEKTLLNKYANELKENFDNLLEADEDEMGLDADPLADLGMSDDASAEADPTAAALPPAATQGEKVCPCPDQGEEIEIDFDELKASMGDEEDELDDMDVLGGEPDMALGESDLDGTENSETIEIPAHLGPELHLYHSGMGDPIYKAGSLAYAGRPVPKDLALDAIGALETLQGKLGNDSDEAELDDLLNQLYDVVPEARSDSGMEDDLSMDEIDLSEIDDSLLEEILESLEVDLEEVPVGHGLNPSTAEEEHGKDVVLASLADDGRKKEHEDLQKAVKKLTEEKGKLQKQVSSLMVEKNNLKDIAMKAAEKLQEQNIINAKLLYTNRVLKNTSLNERQKQIVVERLSKVGSVEQARIVYDTLQSTLNESKKPSGKRETLSEHVNRGNFLSVKTESENNTKANPIIERNQRLAGIKK